MLFFKSKRKIICYGQKKTSSIWRKLFFGTFILIGLLITSAITLSFYIDTNQFKNLIIAEVKTQTGYDLIIDGPVRFSLLPSPAIKVEYMRFKQQEAKAPIFLELVNTSLKLNFAHGKKQLNGIINIAGLRFLNIFLEDVHAKISWKNPHLTIYPLSAKLYEGELNGKLEALWPMKDDTTWRWQLQLDHIFMAPLLTDALGKDIPLKLETAATASFQGSAQGKTKERIFQSLSGVAELRTLEGDVSGVDINYLIKTADNLLNKTELSTPEEFARTHFNSFNASLNLENGIIRTSNLTIAAPQFSITAKGQIDLNHQHMNYHLLAAPLEVKTRWMIPIKMVGQLSRPSIQLDMEQIQNVIAKEKMEALEAKAKEKLEDVAPEAKQLLEAVLQR